MQQIYILEDSQDIGYILELLLVNEGFDVEVFPNVAAIKSRMKDELPDLFLLDIMLPDGNGLALCQEIKEDSDTRNIPVVMMSAHMSPEKIVPEIHTDGFISKPFDLDDVTKRLHSLLKPNLN
ncbi:response regulator transcription factor [Pedobacter sp. AW31-3R]|uniref:response regulator transcription factor n=1 Tax=Pedobacter sp. AW31-3R TaxID=3445781 RepID=UPI003F9FD8FB